MGNVKNALPQQLRQAKEALEATDIEMAKRLNMGLDTYRTLEQGARLLPMPARRAIEKRVGRLLRTCGLE